MTEAEELAILRVAFVELVKVAGMQQGVREILYGLHQKSILPVGTDYSPHGGSMSQRPYSEPPSNGSDEWWDEITRGRTIPSVNPTSSDGFYPRVTPRPASNKRKPK